MLHYHFTIVKRDTKAVMLFIRQGKVVLAVLNITKTIDQRKNLDINKQLLFYC